MVPRLARSQTTISDAGGEAKFDARREPSRGRHRSRRHRKYSYQSASYCRCASWRGYARGQPMSSQLPRPGVTKVRRHPLLIRRQIHLVATAAGPLRELFDAADVVSEGKTTDDKGRLTYYGTTSLLLTPR